MVGIKNFDRGQISIVYPAPARRGTSRQGPAKTCLEMGDWKYDILHSPAISDITTDVLWIEDVWSASNAWSGLVRPGRTWSDLVGHFVS